jgi:23S rRNA-/tRNA-specific pseudouridylate synthase
LGEAGPNRDDQLAAGRRHRLQRPIEQTAVGQRDPGACHAHLAAEHGEHVALVDRLPERRVGIHQLECEGELAETQTVDAPLIRIGPISFGVGEGGKRAMTIVTPIRSTPRGSLIAVDLLTGRTHQIRVHLAAIGHPLAGDWLYGRRNEVRPMLHARELSMMHPLTNEPLRVSAPVPDDFRHTAEERGIVSGSEDIMTLGEST